MRFAKFRVATVRFGSVTVRAWNGSSGSGFRFRRFLCKKGFSLFQYTLTGKDGSGSGFGSWKTVPAVPVPLSVSGQTVPAVPVPVPVRFLSHPENCLVPNWALRLAVTHSCRKPSKGSLHHDVYGDISAKKCPVSCDPGHIIISCDGLLLGLWGRAR